MFTYSLANTPLGQSERTYYRELKQRRFWATHVNRKWDLFPLYCTFTQQNLYRLEINWAKQMLKNTKSPISVDVRLSKKVVAYFSTSLTLRFPFHRLWDSKCRLFRGISNCILIAKRWMMLKEEINIACIRFDLVDKYHEILLSSCRHAGKQEEWLTPICHLRNKRGMRPAIVSGIVTGIMMHRSSIGQYFYVPSYSPRSHSES